MMTTTLSPFSLSPDPGMMLETAGVKQAIFKVIYVVEQRQGLTTILGDVGLGKSTVLRAIHASIASRPEFVTAFLPSPNYPSDFSLLKAICAEYKLPARRSMLAQENELRVFVQELYGEGRTAVVFIDEAQRLPGKQLELVRVLLNLETNTAKLIQIVLSAQRELENKLRDPSKKALASRIFLPTFLSPMSLQEASAMIEHRCSRAGVRSPFDADAVQIIYNISKGVPRDILKIANAAYALAQMQGVETVDGASIPAIAKEAMLNVQPTEA
jgi:type II secretory pathway predicted ATPase ExeA